MPEAKKNDGSDEPVDAYNINLRAPIHCEVRESPYRRTEWHKIMNGT